jgi:hypothetical protein
MNMFHNIYFFAKFFYDFYDSRKENKCFAETCQKELEKHIYLVFF